MRCANCNQRLTKGVYYCEKCNTYMSFEEQPPICDCEKKLDKIISFKKIEFIWIIIAFAVGFVLAKVI